MKSLYNACYALRTVDVDFAVQAVQLRKQMHADLEKLITSLGFTDYIASQGIQKFTTGSYEVEFITQRPGGKTIGAMSIREWNINAIFTFCGKSLFLK